VKEVPDQKMIIIPRVITGGLILRIQTVLISDGTGFQILRILSFTGFIYTGSAILTLMNPSLNYSQAIKGIATGRKVGVIDGIHLIEVARAIDVFRESDIFPEQDYQHYKRWFNKFLSWLINHPFGIEEMNAGNNHATAWVLQTAVFAKFTQNKEVSEFCKNRFMSVLLPGQMAADGSFPLELERTKPYGYSLFNLDAMAMICQVLSDN
jgi:hypothetical protein